MLTSWLGAASFPEAAVVRCTHLWSPLQLNTKNWTPPVECYSYGRRDNYKWNRDLITSCGHESASSHLHNCAPGWLSELHCSPKSLLQGAGLLTVSWSWPLSGLSLGGMLFSCWISPQAPKAVVCLGLPVYELQWLFTEKLWDLLNECAWRTQAGEMQNNKWIQLCSLRVLLKKVEYVMRTSFNRSWPNVPMLQACEQNAICLMPCVRRLGEPIKTASKILKFIFIYLSWAEDFRICNPRHIWSVQHLCFSVVWWSSTGILGGSIKYSQRQMRAEAATGSLYQLCGQ